MSKLFLKSIAILSVSLFVSQILSLYFPMSVLAYDHKESSRDIVHTILASRDPQTKLSPSHLGHPGFENLGFLYDKAVDALILKAAGHQKEAEEILNYFADRLELPSQELRTKADVNGTYGIIKILPQSPQDPIKGLTNALDISSNTQQGTGLLEFYTTPGPLSFLIFAFLQVNPEKYKNHAVIIGTALLSMQDQEGGIRDGDRAPERVYTEPHVDTYAALRMLYQVTKNPIWINAAKRNHQWFEHYVFHPERYTIDQGMWGKEINTIFALDCYSWTMAGPMGDQIKLQTLRKLTLNMLRQSISKITLSLPDHSFKTVLLVDFSDPGDSRIMKARQGFHPMGSVEWTGGTILALQKNATRFWNAKQKTIAIFYKSLAESLLAETKKCFYTVNGKKITFYATGQGIEVAPFGGLVANTVNGWRTPFFFSKSPDNKILVKGGSLVGAWPTLPELRTNPFILNDNYGEIYTAIPVTSQTQEFARKYLNQIGEKHSYVESPPAEPPLAVTQINEPQFYNRAMWKELNAGLQASRGGDRKLARESFHRAILYATKVTGNPIWVKLAQQENKIKQREIGGLIDYPWGREFVKNESSPSSAIWHYPLLNEVGVAMWGSAVAYYKLGDLNNAQYWIKRIVEEVPLHQIAATKDDETPSENPSIIGYWNALVSWQDNPGNSTLDEQMKNLYQKILQQKGMNNYRPEIIDIPFKPSGT